MKNRIRLLLLFVFISPTIVNAQFNTATSYALIKRIIPARAGEFIVEKLPDTTRRDVFELDDSDNKIILRGNNGVAVASALYYYLTEYTHCQVTWNGTNLNLPKKLPRVQGRVHKTTPYQYRYYLNYCTYSYSMSWWDWKRWEKEIDWMALHGINMPLALTGQEYTWYKVYKDLGFSDQELSTFFSGPAYFGWFWMGNLDGWGGPLPLRWMTSHRDLQQQILSRERELGMKAILPSFTGHVPAAFKDRFPKSQLKKTNWNNGFGDTYILDTKDPMFEEIGNRFLSTQKALYGTDHLYSADTFNENEPPTDDPVYLSALSARIYQAMSKTDPKAVWVMQGWLFYSDRKFWKTPQIKALLNAVPDDHMIMLDLATEIEPVWKRTSAYYGKPWIWNMLHNFGGNNSIFGRMEGVAKGPAEALRDSTSGKMQGIGLTMEAIEQTPVLYELMSQHVWQDQQVNLTDWLPKYLQNRYGKVNEHAVRAWNILKKTAFNGEKIRDGAESIITGRPTFDSATVWTRTPLNYKREDFLPAWDEMIKAIPYCLNSDGFNYDLVDISRQALANYAAPLQKRLVKAYQGKNRSDFKKYSDEYLQLISDMDVLLATRKDFLLGPWLADARSWGTTPAEKALYERNARNLITLWGGANSPLREYSCRQWSGLLSSYYKVRWEKFFALAEHSLTSGDPMDLAAFDKNIGDWEWKWVNTEQSYSARPTGNSIDIALKMYKKYRKLNLLN